jgi:hypothetical protein
VVGSHCGPSGIGAAAPAIAFGGAPGPWGVGSRRGGLVVGRPGTVLRERFRTGQSVGADVPYREHLVTEIGHQASLGLAEDDAFPGAMRWRWAMYWRLSAVTRQRSFRVMGVMAFPWAGGR